MYLLFIGTYMSGTRTEQYNEYRAEAKKAITHGKALLKALEGQNAEVRAILGKGKETLADSVKGLEAACKEMETNYNFRKTYKNTKDAIKWSKLASSIARHPQITARALSSLREQNNDTASGFDQAKDDCIEATRGICQRSCRLNFLVG
jgi:rubrerythrin